MPIRDPNAALRRAQQFLQNGAIGNLRAQAHARAILRHLDSAPADWPHFREDLDDRLHHSAHFLLGTALQLLEAGQPQADVNPLLLAASEALEFLCDDPRYPTPVRIEQAVNATFGYYLAGHYARSYVLLREAIPDSAGLPPLLGLLVSVFRKQLGVARQITIGHFSAPMLQDAVIAEQLGAGELSEDEAYERVLLSAAARAVSFFLEFPKNGEAYLLQNAIAVLDDAILVAREKGYVDWWWWLYCLRFLFREFGRVSTWTGLAPLRGGQSGEVLVNAYIRAGLHAEPPVLELWPSQLQALPTITDPERRNFCLKMPTSSGKTRIAELAIVQFFQDYGTDEAAKCIYVAPFRSLAVEVEQTLRRSLGALGLTVSQLYGGFEVSPADAVFLQRYRILIATPEKFDALLRFEPELAASIRLVIIDEGHIVDPDDRGLRFEFFVHRLLRRLRRPTCRFVFISAVLPNADQFAEWVTGSPENLVESTWRPSRLMLGRLGWDGSRVRIDYTHQHRERFGQECYVPRFIEQEDCKGVAGLGRRRKPFPGDAGEAFALAALRYAKEGTTLVFVPQQKNVEPFARSLLEALTVYRCLRRSKGEEFQLPTPGRGSGAWERCRTAIQAEMGEDSLLLRLLDEGILVHHGRLPWRVRVAVEELARTEALRLIVATTTLAQGINLPIQSVLVRGLQIDHNRLITPMTFWNICGRAGRAMRENEGHILFCVDGTAPTAKRRRQTENIAKVVDALEQARVTSTMLLVLRRVVKEWRLVHPDVDLSQLCLYLLENKFEWASEEHRQKLQALINVLDGHLLTLCEEFALDPTNPDALQEFLTGSLLSIQLRDNAVPDLTPEVARDIFQARVGFIHRQHPDPHVRQRLYRLGMSLSACQTIEAEHHTLLALFQEAEGWFGWSQGQRTALLERISTFIFQLPDTAPDKPLPAEWPMIFSSWLAGMSTTAMVRNAEIARFSDSPSKLCLFLEKVCGYLLPWGLNSLLTYLTAIAEEHGQTLPPICSYFAGMVKYGVADPVAVCFVPSMDLDRPLALAAAAACPHTFEHPELAVDWLLHVSAGELEAAGVPPAIAQSIIERRNRQGGSAPSGGPGAIEGIDVAVDQAVFERVTLHEKVVVVPDDAPGASCQLFSVAGALLGRYEHPQGAIPQWWRDGRFLDSEVVSKRRLPNGSHQLTIHLLLI